jgi:hypothetical protein
MPERVAGGRRRSLKKRAMVLAVCVLGVAMVAAAAEKEHPDFSGTWVLLKSATPDVPTTLESYTMVATQADQQITLTTKIEGDFRPSRHEILEGQDPNEGGRDKGDAPNPDADSNSSGGGAYPASGGGNPAVGGFPRGATGGVAIGGTGPQGGGFPGGADGAPMGRQSAARVLAVSLPDGPYTLNGQETTFDLSGRIAGKATAKAKWVKGGKEIELAVRRRLDVQGNVAEIQSTERWKLSSDGLTLTVHRIISGPQGSQSAKLVFRKVSEDAQKSQ